MPQAHAHPAPADLGPAFRRAVGLNVGYVLVEAAAGFPTGSLALLADAAHTLTEHRPNGAIRPALPDQPRPRRQFRRRVRTQTVLPCAETVPMLLWALLASGRIRRRKVDGRETPSRRFEPMPLDLAA